MKLILLYLCVYWLCVQLHAIELSHFELALPGEDKKDVGCVQHREDEVEDEADKKELSHLRGVSFSKRHATAIKILLYHHDHLILQRPFATLDEESFHRVGVSTGGCA